MARETDIEWCDSTLNLMMGCNGCELFNPKTGEGDCYAFLLTRRYGGRKGWPASFDQPSLFLDRLESALRWPDLTGTKRPDKPWLDGLPRMIFLNDMGDTFTESLPIDWLLPILPRLAASPHHWMLLTKRGRRMRQLSEMCSLPGNVWPGVSVTTQARTRRIDELVKVKGGGPKWISAEPLWDSIDLWPWLTPKVCGCTGNTDCECFPGEPRIQLAIFGGHSGQDAPATNLADIRRGVDQCATAGIAAFVKQLGSRPVIHESMSAAEKLYPGGVPKGLEVEGIYEHHEWLSLKHPKGGDPAEWPEDLRVRDFPRVETAHA